MTQAVHAVRSDVEHVDADPDDPVRIRLGDSDVFVDVDRLEQTVDAGGVATEAGVEAINARARGDLPEWQRIGSGWWEADDDLTHGARERMTDRERQVYRSVKVHGMRPADLAQAGGMDPSTIRSVLRSAVEKRGVQR